MKTKLNVKGMHCKSCEMLLKDALEDIGVQATANAKTGEVTVEYDDAKTDLATIKKIIKKEGYDI